MREDFRALLCDCSPGGLLLAAAGGGLLPLFSLFAVLRYPNGAFCRPGAVGMPLWAIALLLFLMGSLLCLAALFLALRGQWERFCFACGSWLLLLLWIGLFFGRSRLLLSLLPLCGSLCCAFAVCRRRRRFRGGFAWLLPFLLLPGYLLFLRLTFSVYPYF